MSSVDFDEFHKHKAEPTERYFLNPFMYWWNLRYGETGPSQFIMGDVPVNRDSRGLTTQVKRFLTETHNPQEGTKIHTAILPESHRAVAVVNNHGSPFMYTDIPGFHEPGDTHRYDWERGLASADAYYFVDQEASSIVSLHDVIYKHLGIPVSIYLYSDYYPNETSRSQALQYVDGQQGYALFTQFPRSVFDVISVLHEGGHVVFDKKAPDRWEELESAAGITRAMEEYRQRWSEISASGKPSYERWRKQMELKNAHEQSDVAMRYMGAEMIYEYEVWGATIPLLEQSGMMSVFQSCPKALINFIFWAIKTRLK